MQIFDSYKSSINQPLDVIEGHSIAIKREDLIHPIISGNKFRKLKYILKEVVDDNIPIVITFGGAFSNHLAATASAGKSLGIRTLGIVRGEEWKNKICLSSTLSFCQKQGMRLICVPRAIYAKKEAAYEIQKILKKYPRYRLIPEGGTEILSLKGCSEILQPEDFGFDSVCCSIGTGGTLTGLIQASLPKQQVLGFNALKNPSVKDFILSQTKKTNWEINPDYTFGGYAKTDDTLISFMNAFYQQYKIPLDPIYTGKMLFAIFDLIKTYKWKWGKRILIIHTGGLQSIAGMNTQLQKKNALLISYEKEFF
jgi:1-aminocyclopropane-1-carboxylate deaminase